MAINKNAYIRYQTLDKCFRNRFKKYFIVDLLEEVNNALGDFNGLDSSIEKRQLYDDINFMKSEAGWVIPLKKEKDGRKVYYRYADPDFSINSSKIRDEEVEAINAALIVLASMKGLPQFGWVNELIPKLQSLFNFKDDSIKVISFDHNEYLKGLDYLPTLYQCIVNQVCINVRYKSFKEVEAKNYLVHPYFLKQYNKRWFLFGAIDEDGFLINLALDRIQHIDHTTIKYRKNESHKFEDYFEDIIGVTRFDNKEPIKIHLSFNASMAPYVLTKPLHGSQKKISQDQKKLVIQLEVIPNFELKQLILSYGGNIEILYPESYRAEFKESVQKMNDIYFKL